MERILGIVSRNALDEKEGFSPGARPAGKAMMHYEVSWPGIL